MDQSWLGQCDDTIPILRFYYFRHITSKNLRELQNSEAVVYEVLSKPIRIDKIGSRAISLCAENV